MSRGALVTFTWLPRQKDCKLVQVAGSFTSWQPVDMLPPLKHNINNNNNQHRIKHKNKKHQSSSGGYWTLQRWLDPGQHEYKYVVDGQWLHDDSKECHENDMGSKNNIIKIEEYHKGGAMSRDHSVDSQCSQPSGNCDDTDDDTDDDDEDGICQNQEWEVLLLNNNGHAETTSRVSSSGEGSRSSMAFIEVERKFHVPPDYQSRLESCGFTPVQAFHEILEDDYYDYAPDFPLLAHDHWLRKRNSDWELKYPVDGGTSRNGSPTKISSTSSSSTKTTSHVYHETTDHDYILSKLRVVMLPHLLSSCGGDDDDKDEKTKATAILSNLVSTGILTPFAHIRTKRKCFRRDADNVNVVIDVTEDCFEVGEIEMLVESKDQVIDATFMIDALAQELKFTRMDLTFISNLVLNSNK